MMDLKDALQMSAATDATIDQLVEEIVVWANAHEYEVKTRGILSGHLKIGIRQLVREYFEKWEG